MYINRLFPIFVVVVALSLPACGPSPAEFDATVTQMAANVFQTQTAQAPTATQTIPPSPTPTSTPIPTSTPRPSPTATRVPPTPTVDPSILFTDDFSNPDSVWGLYDDDTSRIEYADDKLQFAMNQQNFILTNTISRFYSNVTIEVEANNIKGPQETIYGVICRYQDSSNYYLLGIASDGHYAIAKRVANQWYLIESNELGLNNVVINGGIEINHIKGSCTGEELILEVNGEVLMNVKDSTFSSGAIGLLVNTMDQPGAVVQFDNFMASKP